MNEEIQCKPKHNPIGVALGRMEKKLAVGFEICMKMQRDLE